MQYGDQDKSENHPQRAGHAYRYVNVEPQKDIAHHIRHDGLADPTQSEVRMRSSMLRGSQIPMEMLDDVIGRGSHLIARLGFKFYLGCTDCDDGKFCRYKISIFNDQ